MNARRSPRRSYYYPLRSNTKNYKYRPFLLAVNAKEVRHISTRQSQTTLIEITLCFALGPPTKTKFLIKLAAVTLNSFLR